MPSSSWKRFSMSVRRMRAFCWSLRIRSSCFLPCSSATQGLCCHCWIRWGRISKIRLQTEIESILLSTHFLTVALCQCCNLCSYLAASFMPHSSEQYLELARAASTQLGPRHCRCPPPSLASPLLLCRSLSLCFCFGLCRRDSFWCKFTKTNPIVHILYCQVKSFHFYVFCHDSNIPMMQ